MRKIKKIVFSTALTSALLLSSACTQAPTATYYSVSVQECQNGTVFVQEDRIMKNGGVEISILPQDGFILQKLTINGEEVKVYNDSYYLYGIDENVSVEAKFVSKYVKVSFESENGEKDSEKTYCYGEKYGELLSPQPIAGKRFVGWYTEEENGELITENSVVETLNGHTLYARWEDFSEEEKETLRPYSVTFTLYDSLAEKYGVTFHTDAEPYYPVVQISQNSGFSNARILECETVFWQNHYVNMTVLDDLEFDTEYFYRVGDPYADVWGDIANFETRAEGQTDASFVFVSDSQQTKKNANMGIEICDLAKVLKDATERFPQTNFIAHGGDFVNYGGDQSYWKEMLGDINEYVTKYPMVVATGNHEEVYSYANGIMDLMPMMFNINTEDRDSSYGQYYSFDYGLMHFVVLASNDSYRDSSRAYTQAQLNWLRADLEQNKQSGKTKWTVVLVHEGAIIPSYSFKEPVERPTVSGYYTVNQTTPIFREYGVDLVLHGHDHYTHSTYPLGYEANSEELIKIVTKETVSVSYDGETVAEYTDYQSGVQGTVFHEVGCAGRGWNTYYDVKDLQTNLEKYVYFRYMGSGGAGLLFENDPLAYSMYDYIEVSENKLVVRTYAVNYETEYDYTVENGTRSKLVDGFILNK